MKFMKVIGLHMDDNASDPDVFVNYDNITTIAKNGDKTRISFTDGSNIDVREAHYDVANKINHLEK